jgi:hypothetical protein
MPRLVRIMMLVRSQDAVPRGGVEKRAVFFSHIAVLAAASRIATGSLGSNSQMGVECSQ